MCGYTFFNLCSAATVHDVADWRWQLSRCCTEVTRSVYWMVGCALEGWACHVNCDGIAMWIMAEWMEAKAASMVVFITHSVIFGVVSPISFLGRDPCWLYLCWGGDCTNTCFIFIVLFLLSVVWLAECFVFFYERRAVQCVGDVLVATRELRRRVTATAVYAACRCGTLPYVL